MNSFHISEPNSFGLTANGSLSRLSRQNHLPDNPCLLLLRVFSLGQRSEQLFRAVSTHWRYLGKIHLIAGPDLATTTIEPHEFLDYVSRNLGHNFIDQDHKLEKCNQRFSKPQIS